MFMSRLLMSCLFRHMPPVLNFLSTWINWLTRNYCSILSWYSNVPHHRFIQVMKINFISYGSFLFSDYSLLPPCKFFWFNLFGSLLDGVCYFFCFLNNSTTLFIILHLSTVFIRRASSIKFLSIVGKRKY